MHSSLIGVGTRHAEAIAAAVREELRPYGIDESRVEITGHSEPAAERVLSIGVIVDGADSSPMLIETDRFQVSLEAQMDLLRAWLRAGHPAQLSADETVQYKAGQTVRVPDATEPLVAARDSYNNRVWVVSPKDPTAEAVPYLIFPDGSLVREQQHGLPD
jgi:hypothetical protein